MSTTTIYAIPVDIEDALAMLNLPGDLKNNAIFGQHSGLVLNTLQSVTKTDAYTEATTTGVNGASKPYPWTTTMVAFRLAYAFLLLQSTCEFLNLKTQGEGIVKVTGTENSQTELLTGKEIEAFKNNLEMRALQVLKLYLSQTGLNRLEVLSPRVKSKLKAGII